MTLPATTSTEALRRQWRLPTWAAAAAVVVAVMLLGGCGSSDPDGSATAPTTAAASAPSTTVTTTTVATSVLDGTTPGGDLAFLGPVRTVAVGDITMGFRRFGAGPPVVLVVGQDSSMSYWGAELPRRLAAHHEVTMFDNRGVATSTDRPDVPLTIELMGDDTAGLIAALGLDHPTVVGWSTGGEIALAMAVRHPDAAGALVLSGATAGGSLTVPSSPEIDRLLASTDIADQAKLLDHLFTPSGADARNAYLAGLGAVPGGAVSPAIIERQAEAEAAFVRSVATADGLPGIRTPTVVVNGAQDDMVPPENARRIAAAIPGAELRIVDDAAHALMFQVMDWFVSVVDAASAGGAIPAAP